uniref:Uncharacterized protein n=1 Tax=Taeniopygia guttata TaxID=59729 RepID=A0A674G9C2_TAEGU
FPNNSQIIPIFPQALQVLLELLLLLGPGLPHTRLRLRAEAALEAQVGLALLDTVFVPREDNENPASPESLQRRRALLAAFCRLLLRGALPLRAATDLFKHYAKFSGDFGDILRETLRETRQRDGAEWARTLLLSLQQLFTELLLQEGPALRRLPEFQEIRDLGRRLSLFFSLRHLRHRRPLLQLHSEGIAFSLLPRPGLGAVPGIPSGFPLNLPFLEVLSEFSARLQRPDRAHLLSLLERRWRELGLGPDFGADLGDFGADLGDFGAPLLCYRRSLSAAPGPARGRRAPRSNERQQRAPSSSPWPPTPTLTSTALRGGPQKRRPSPTLPRSEPLPHPKHTPKFG